MFFIYFFLNIYIYSSVVFNPIFEKNSSIEKQPCSLDPVGNVLGVFELCYFRKTYSR